MNARPAVRAVVVLIALVLWAHPALACSVCVGTGTPDTRNAWIAMTAFMTFTPLSIVLGVILWIRHQYKAFETEEQAQAVPGQTDSGLHAGQLPS